MFQLYKNIQTDFLGEIFLELFQFKTWSRFSVFEQNCENTTAKKIPETRTKKDFLFLKEPTFCQKCQLVKLAQKLRNSQLLRQTLT